MINSKDFIILLLKYRQKCKCDFYVKSIKLPKILWNYFWKIYGINIKRSMAFDNILLSQWYNINKLTSKIVLILKDE